MKKLLFIFAFCICQIGIVMSTNVSITKVSEYSDSLQNLPSWLKSTIVTRGMHLHNGKLYLPLMSYPANGITQIQIVDVNNLQVNVDSIQTADNFGSMTISEKGVVYAAWFGVGTFAPFKIDADGTKTPVFSYNYKEKGYPGNRTDQFEVYGDVEGDTGGYFVVVTVPRTDAVDGVNVIDGKKVFIWEVKNGVPVDANAPIIIELDTQSGYGCSALFKDANSLYIKGSSIRPALYNVNGNSIPAIPAEGPSALFSQFTSAIGIARFEFKERMYFVSAYTNTGLFEIFDITDGLDNAVKIDDKGVISRLGKKTPGTDITPICVDVKNDGVNIYVFSSKNGIACYKLSENSTGINSIENDMEKKISLDRNKNTIKITDINGVVELFSLQGVLLKRDIVNGSYFADLGNGAYVLRINGVSYKITL